MQSITQEDEPHFGCVDFRKEYGGKVTSTRRKCSANFNQPPKRPSDGMSDGARGSAGSDGCAVASASKGEKEKASNRGEKEKAPRRQSSDRSATRGGGSANRGESSASGDDEGEVSVDDDFYFPDNKLGRLCWYLGKARGEAICTFCRGVCCSSMQDLINILINYDEAKPSQKVYLLFIC